MSSLNYGIMLIITVFFCITGRVQESATEGGDAAGEPGQDSRGRTRYLR